MPVKDSFRGCFAAGEKIVFTLIRFYLAADDLRINKCRNYEKTQSLAAG